MTTDEHIDAGQSALAEGRWEDARTAFETALAKRETPEALDGLGRALWWLGETQLSVQHQERAYVEYRRTGNAAEAAMTALALCVTYTSNYGNEAAASGWLGRAERLLQDSDLAPLQGWLWVTRGYLSSDVDAAIELLERGLEFARESGDLDLELCALADLGEKLVMAGRVESGLALIDEAMAGVLAGETSRFDTIVFACCDMLVACDLAGDLERATQWCRVADDFIHKYGCPFLYGRCRTLYGSILVAKGRWAEGEQELTAALRMTAGVGPSLQEEAIGRLADLRLRQGRIEEAEALIATFGESEVTALPAASLRLTRGEPAVAVGILERRLKLLGEVRLETAPTLALLVEAQLVLGDVNAASETSARLGAAARTHDHGLARALAAHAAARVSAARERTDEAIGHLETALEHFARLDLPLETARVRFELARALTAHRPELAVAEASTAFAVFDRVGAGPDADATAALLRSLGATGRTGPKRVGVLTKREQEVLRLVGLGLSNPEIAQRLFISRKTVSHHVSSVLAKLGLRNRAEAVAYVARTLGEPAPK